MRATTPGQRHVAVVMTFLLGALLSAKAMMAVLAIAPSIAASGIDLVRTRPAAEMWLVAERSTMRVAAEVVIVKGHQTLSCALPAATAVRQARRLDSLEMTTMDADMARGGHTQTMNT